MSRLMDQVAEAAARSQRDREALADDIDRRIDEAQAEGYALGYIDGWEAVREAMRMGILNEDNRV